MYIFLPFDRSYVYVFIRSLSFLLPVIGPHSLMASSKEKSRKRQRHDVDDLNIFTLSQPLNTRLSLPSSHLSFFNCLNITLEEDTLISSQVLCSCFLIIQYFSLYSPSFCGTHLLTVFWQREINILKLYIYENVFILLSDLIDGLDIELCTKNHFLSKFWRYFSIVFSHSPLVSKSLKPFWFLFPCFWPCTSGYL